MKTRADLLAAVAAAGPAWSGPWLVAVRALGAASRAGFPPPPVPTRRGAPTGKSYYQTIWGITRSHHFTEAERASYRDRAQWEHGSEPLYQEVTRLVRERAAAERDATRAATQAA